MLSFPPISLSLSEILTCFHVAVSVSPLEGKALSFLPSRTVLGTVDNLFHGHIPYQAIGGIFKQ